MLAAQFKRDTRHERTGLRKLEFLLDSEINTIKLIKNKEMHCLVLYITRGIQRLKIKGDQKSTK